MKYPVWQVPVDWLLQKADGMFPEGKGGPRAFAKDGAAAEKTNELLENATTAIDQLFKQRGYDPKKPAEVNVRERSRRAPRERSPRRRLPPAPRSRRRPRGARRRCGRVYCRVVHARTMHVCPVRV